MRPSARASVPASGCRSPPMTRSSVDLPAPLRTGQRDAFGTADAQVNTVVSEELSATATDLNASRLETRCALRARWCRADPARSCRRREAHVRRRRAGPAPRSPVWRAHRRMRPADSCALRFIAPAMIFGSPASFTLRAAVLDRRAARSRASCRWRFSRLSCCSALRRFALGDHAATPAPPVGTC